MCRTVGNQFVVEIIAAQKTSFAGRLQTNTNEKGNFILFKYLHPLSIYLYLPSICRIHLPTMMKGCVFVNWRKWLGFLLKKDDLVSCWLHFWLKWLWPFQWFFLEIDARIELLDLKYVTFGTKDTQFHQSWSFSVQTVVYIEAEWILRPRGSDEDICATSTCFYVFFS